MVKKLSKNEAVHLENLFLDSMIQFVEKNKESITKIIIDSVNEKLNGICKLIISQSLNWYKGELKFYFEDSLQKEVKRCMKENIDNITTQVSFEVKGLFEEGDEFKKIVKEMVSKKIKSTISSCLKEEISEEMISQILNK